MTAEAPLRALYEDVPRPIVALASEYPPGHATGLHRHARGQLIFATSGVMSVTGPAGSWIVPTERAVWIPPGVPHAVETRRGVSMRSIYVALGAMPAPARRSRRWSSCRRCCGR